MGYFRENRINISWLNVSFDLPPQFSPHNEYILQFDTKLNFKF